MGRSIQVCAALALAACGSVKANQDHVDAPAQDPKAPVVTISKGPPAQTEMTTATFEFSADKTATFECQLDTSTATACTSPQTFSGLAVGGHMLTIQGRDAAGNVGTATASWTVVAPCMTALVEGESFASVATGWILPAGGVLHGGQELEADSAGLSFQFDFTAKGLVVHTEDGPNRGTIRFTVDGGTPVDVQTMAPGSFTFQVPHNVAAGLANASHHVLVQCPTAICSIDFFDYVCN